MLRTSSQKQGKKMDNNTGKCCLIFLWLLLIGGTPALSAQTDSLPRDSTGIRFFGLPLVFYSNDTRGGIGIGGVLTFPGHPLRSSVTVSVAYTQRKQWLLYFPYQWYSRNGQWRVYGEAGWYRYLYQYFGIGNSYPNTFLETYTAQYPRLRVTVAKNRDAHQLFGLRYSMDSYHIIGSSAGSEIAEHKITGSEGGFSSGLGPVWLYDSRDNQFFPHQGWLVEASAVGETQLIGSDFEYARLGIDVARYWPTGPKTVLATQVIGAFTFGKTPFFLLPQIGGSKRLRGYPDGKYRDRYLIAAQAEWRFPLFWRFKGVLFGATGTVFGTPGEALHWRPEGGAGLRIEFDRKQHLHIRIDYGIGAGADNSGFYLTFGEAF